VPDPVDLYDTTYGSFETVAREQVRRETYGEDLGQNSWLTAEELRRFLGWLDLAPSSHVLEVGSGSGGPALFIAQLTGARITGIDVNTHAVAGANKVAQDRHLHTSAHFLRADAGLPLPFAGRTFDAVICIDTINHLRDRARVLAEWHRVLKEGGRVLFTDPVIVTGLISNEEIAIRSSIGYFLFAPPGENESLLAKAGFEMVRTEDVTQNVALVAERWHKARISHREALVGLEGERTFDGLQRFLAATQVLAREQRLSRHAFLARKPEGKRQSRPTTENSHMSAQTAESLLTDAEGDSQQLRALQAKALRGELDQQYGDVLSALEWFLDQDRVDEAFRLLNSLVPFWMATARLDATISAGACESRKTESYYS